MNSVHSDFGPALPRFDTLAPFSCLSILSTSIPVCKDSKRRIKKGFGDRRGEGGSQWSNTCPTCAGTLGFKPQQGKKTGRGEEKGVGGRRRKREGAGKRKDLGTMKREAFSKKEMYKRMLILV